MDATITLRPAGAGDEAFLFSLYVAGRRDELLAVGWDEPQILEFCQLQFKAQTWHHGLLHPEATDQIISANDSPIGRIKVAENDQELLLLDIALLPDYQGKGIGTRLIEDLKAAATAAAKPLRLHALAGNVGGVRLYERLGFTRVAGDGLYLAMEFCPAGSKPIAKEY